MGSAILAANGIHALVELRAILENATVGILFSKNRKLMQLNPLCAEMFGYTVDELIGQPSRILYPSEETFEAIAAEAGPALAAGQSFRTEVEMARKDGSTFYCRLSGKAVDPLRHHAGTIWIMEDATERRAAEQALRQAKDELEQRVLERTEELTKANQQLQKEVFERAQAEQRIWHVAHHDALTGLPNRTLLHDRLEQALGQANRDNHRVGVMFLDLDRFKSINDTLGHAVGDELLKQVAERLTSAVRAVDTVSRLGGDEFVVVLRELAGPDDAALVAEKILKALATPIPALGHELRATTSIGISIYPDDGAEVVQLMKNADTAMYCAKSSGRNNFKFFAQHMNEEATRAFRLEQQLRCALDQGELMLHYQPQVDLDTLSVRGVEALLRWRHPQHGMMSPAEFIPVAEETGLILPLGEWVLAEALRQNRAWQTAGHPPLRVSVNLSPRQFRQKGLADTIRALLAETGQPAGLLELEITESSLMHDVDQALDTLNELAGMGVRLAIDDFGTGYSSLNYLKRFPVHKLKIDRGFVSDLGVDEGDAAIIAAVVGLARALGLETLAEGVETPMQIGLLGHYGCCQVQGFYFSRPLPPEEIESLFEPDAFLTKS